MIKSLAFFASLSLVCALVACGSSDSSGSEGTAGSAGTDGGAGSSGTITATTGVLCYKDAAKVCTDHIDDDAAGTMSDQMDCTSDGGTLVDKCPSAGVVGCCILFGIMTECDYDASNTIEAGCKMETGTWVTSVPLRAHSALAVPTAASPIAGSVVFFCPPQRRGDTFHP